MTVRIHPGAIVGAILLGGCLPSLPPLNLDAEGTGTDTGADDEDGVGSETGTGPFGESTDDDDGTDGGTEDETGDTSNDDASDEGTGETTGPAEDCEPITPLTHDAGARHTIGNCGVEVVFDESVSTGIAELRAPNGGDRNLIVDQANAQWENTTGVLMYPEQQSWDATPTLGFEVLADGPAVVRLRSTWDADGAFDGSTVYTIVADGRVMRDELANVIVPGRGVWLVAYTAVVAERITAVRTGGSTPASDHAPNYGAQLGPQEHGLWNDSGTSLCAFHDVNGDALHVTLASDSLFVGTRLTEDRHEADDDSSVAMVLQADWVRDMPLSADEHVGAIMTHMGASTQDDPCSVGDAFSDAYRNPGTVSVVNGSEATSIVTAQGDENADGFSEGGGFYAFVAGGNNHLSFTLDGGAAEFPTVLVFIQGRTAADIGTVWAEDYQFEAGEFLVQDASIDIAGVEEDGVFVLLGRPVGAGGIMTIHY